MKNPYLNALLAAVYICALVLIVSTTSNIEIEESIFMPMAAISVFVLSAAIMGFLFVFRPAALYLEGKKQEAILFFGKTVGTFAIFVLGYALTVLVVG